MRCKNIAIVGLGLIGGSILKALQGFDDAVFYGIDRDETVLQQAKEEGLISCERLTDDEILARADVTFVCLPPDAVVQFVNTHTFKEGALVTDVCGVKQAVYQKLTNQSVDFIGGHPMAGKESSGFSASDGKLFAKASYLLTPTEKNDSKHLALLKRMTAYMGCRETVLTTPEEHDAMIAYTSQLMHVVAVALCDSERLDRAKSFSAGSLRDCTRVAKLDSRMWSRLFLLNQKELLHCIDEFSDSLQCIRKLIEAGDEPALESFLQSASGRKLRFLAEQEDEHEKTARGAGNKEL